MLYQLRYWKVHCLCTHVAHTTRPHKKQRPLAPLAALPFYFAVPTPAPSATMSSPPPQPHEQQRSPPDQGQGDDDAAPLPPPIKDETTAAVAAGDGNGGDGELLHQSDNESVSERAVSRRVSEGFIAYNKGFEEW